MELTTFPNINPSARSHNPETKSSPNHVIHGGCRFCAGITCWDRHTREEDLTDFDDTPDLSDSDKEWDFPCETSVRRGEDPT